MSYDVSFDKKSVFILVGGCVAVGVLLFFAGFVLGWDKGTSANRLAVQHQNPPADSQYLPHATTGKAESKNENPPTAEPLLVKSSPFAADPAPKAGASASAESPAPSSATKSSQSETLPTKPETDAAGQQDATFPDPTGFALQVGAFQNENNARRFKSSLESRGYPVFLFQTLDAGGRPWHTVRIGHYPDMEKASQAASSFTGKEKIPVFIRPVNEL